ncbi:MAG: AAA family ATPase [Deltaproteobacteria bacterium]|jgi:hypothetical protein|nr:AAA family ATPase [Deltaproteobacteria bacterium]
MTHKILVQCPSFKKIRSDNLFYADKTEYIYNLVSDSQPKLLCRPFGFGKTLLIDTLEELFNGQRELFAGLWIDSSDYQFIKHPIIRLNLGFAEPLNSEELWTQIVNVLQNVAKSEGLPIVHLNPHLPFEDLIFNLYRKYNPRDPKTEGEEPNGDPGGVKVVVLIDDYDAPILNLLAEPAKAFSIQKNLFSLYRSFQNLEKYCRFILLTGQTNLGSCCDGVGLSYASDISYQAKYAGLCGFTQAETDQLIADQFPSLAPALTMRNQFKPGQTMADLKDLIATWYDGFIFDGSTIFDDKTKDKITRVMCPYSILSFFAKQTFDLYWLYAQNDDFLKGVIAQKPERFIGDDFSSYSKLALCHAENPPMGPLLFQTGYLTLKEVSLSHGLMSYGFKPPNLEISLGFRVAILETLFNLTTIEEIEHTQFKIQKSLASHDQVDWEEAFALAVARLTFRPPRPGDFFYRLVFQLFIYCLGFEVDPEDPANHGRLELVKETFAAKKNRAGHPPQFEPFLP